MKLRTASRLAVITLVVVVGAILYVSRASLASPRSTTLVGTALGGTPAPAIALVDQHGAPVSLARLRGGPVVLAFLATHCGSSCAATAGKLRAALAQLGSAGAHVSLLVVSVDPRGDDPAAVAAFSREQQMSDRWHYLTGTCAQLTPIWAAYGVSGSGCGAGTSSAPATQPTQAAHAQGLFLLDANGRESVYLDSAFTANTLATDLRILAASSR